MRGVVTLLVLTLALGVAGSEEPPAPPKPRLFVVAIAIDEYPEEFGFPPIERKTALADAAKKLVDKLARKQEKGVFSDARTHLLRGKEATPEAIEGALQDVIENATSQDVFVFYFGGAIAGTPVERDLEGDEKSFREALAELEGVLAEMQKAGQPDPKAQAAAEARHMEISEQLQELEELKRRREAVAELRQHHAEVEEVLAGMQKAEQPDPDEMAGVEHDLSMIRQRLAELEAQEDLVVRFVQHGADPGDPDSAMPHFWLAEAFQAVPCASQLVVLDGLLDSRVLNQSDLLKVLLNEPSAGMREYADVRRLLLYPGSSAEHLYPAGRTLVTDCLLDCLESAGDLDETGVVSAAEVRAMLPTVAYRKLAQSKLVEHGTDTSGLEPRSVVLGHNFPLHAVSAVKRGAESTSTRGVGRRRVKKKPEGGADPKRPRQDRALLIAIDKYKHWKDLTNPIFDAKRLRSVLESQYGFKVTLLENPTDVQIEDAIAKFTRLEYGKYDQLLVFFAGHGHYVKKYGTGYIIPTNATRPERDARRPKPQFAIPHRELSFMVDNIPCRHTFLVLDSCFSGTFKKKVGEGGHRGGANYNERKGEELVRHRLRNKGRFYLTSGGAEYVEDGDRGKHSPFARVLIGKLDDAASDGKMLDCWAIAAGVSGIEASTPTAGKFGTSDPGRAEFLFVPKASR